MKEIKLFIDNSVYNFKLNHLQTIEINEIVSKQYTSDYDEMGDYHLYGQFAEYDYLIDSDLNIHLYNVSSFTAD